MTRIAYLAHPYGGKPENLARARRWLRWLNRTHFPGTAFVAPWIDWCEAVRETAENRTAGTGLGCAEVKRIGLVYLVGGSVSPGMRDEMAHASEVVDLTHMGEEPPDAKEQP